MQAKSFAVWVHCHCPHLSPMPLPWPDTSDASRPLPSLNVSSASLTTPSLCGLEHAVLLL